MVCAFTGNRDLHGDGDGATSATDTGEAAAGGEQAAHGDAAAWEEFDIAADRGRARALTFGAGVHYCLGANLARVELQEALAYLPSQMPELTLDGEPVYESIMGIYGLAELPVRFSRA
jgi:cytochrome P450